MLSKVILVTGANSGVGYAIAKVLANAPENFHVIMTSRSLEKTNAAMSEIQASGTKGSLSAIQLDVTDDSSIEKAEAHVREKFGKLDVLINNAGVGARGPNTRDRMRQCMEVNVIGPTVVADVFRPLLLKSEKPYSIYITSGGGSMGRATDPNTPNYRSPFPYAEAYRASKSALNMVAVQESIVYDNTPLKVFIVCPGFVVSNLRGPSEEMRTGYGKAKDPNIPAELILSIVKGEREADAGKFMHADGFYPW